MMVVKSAQKNMTLDVDVSRLTVGAKIYFAVLEEIFLQLCEVSVFKLCNFVKYLFQVSKCTFHKYGVSGTIEKHDALCVLPLNIINEKVKNKKGPTQPSYQ